jgi:hypothetical protein
MVKLMMIQNTRLLYHPPIALYPTLMTQKKKKKNKTFFLNSALIVCISFILIVAISLVKVGNAVVARESEILTFVTLRYRYIERLIIKNFKSMPESFL